MVVTVSLVLVALALLLAVFSGARGAAGYLWTAVVLLAVAELLRYWPR